MPFLPWASIRSPYHSTTSACSPARLWMRHMAIQPWPRIPWPTGLRRHGSPGWIRRASAPPIRPSSPTGRDALDRAGITTRDSVKLTFGVGELFSVLSTVQSSEAYSEHADILIRIATTSTPKSSTGSNEAGTCRRGNTWQATRIRDRLRAEIAELFRALRRTGVADVTDRRDRHRPAGPRYRRTAVEVRSALLSLTCPWNLTGHPALSVPAGMVEWSTGRPTTDRHAGT